MRGEEVTVTRIFGLAPNTRSFSATVIALVEDYQPDRYEPERTGYSGSQLGGISQGDRQIVLLVDDLAAQRFPLPVKKHDRVTLSSNSDMLNIVRVDASKRAVAGGIELRAAGVA